MVIPGKISVPERKTWPIRICLFLLKVVLVLVLVINLSKFTCADNFSLIYSCQNPFAFFMSIFLSLIFTLKELISCSCESKIFFEDYRIYTNIYTVDLPKKMTYSQVMEDLSRYKNITKIRIVDI